MYPTLKLLGLSLAQRPAWWERQQAVKRFRDPGLLTRSRAGLLSGRIPEATALHDEYGWSPSSSHVPLYSTPLDGHPLHHRWFPLAGVYANGPRHRKPTVA